MVNPPGTLYFVPGPLPPGTDRSRMAEYLPIGIQPTVNVPSDLIGTPNRCPLSARNTVSCTNSPSGNFTAFPLWVRRPVKESFFAPVKPSIPLPPPQPAARVARPANKVNAHKSRMGHLQTREGQR